MFDELVDELRTHSTEWLRREREEVVAQQVHHLVPRSRGGTDDIANLAAVCPAHHRLLIPHGLLALVGNPNLPDGLKLVTAGRAPPSVVRA
jgi:hypothetical protein